MEEVFKILLKIYLKLYPLNLVLKLYFVQRSPLVVLLIKSRLFHN